MHFKFKNVQVGFPLSGTLQRFHGITPLARCVNGSLKNINRQGWAVVSLLVWRIFLCAWNHAECQTDAIIFLQSRIHLPIESLARSRHAISFCISSKSFRWSHRHERYPFSSKALNCAVTRKGRRRTCPWPYSCPKYPAVQICPGRSTSMDPPVSCSAIL